MDVSGAALQFGDCRDSELAGFLDRALTIKLPDISNETTDIGTVSSHVPMVCSNWVSGVGTCRALRGPSV